MAAKMSVLGLMLSSSPYPRSANGQFPLTWTIVTVETVRTYIYRHDIKKGKTVVIVRIVQIF